MEKNLDQLRDEKCIPLARSMFKDIASDMIPEDANVVVDYNPVLIKLLSKTLEADTNISMENPYLFQLILGVLSGLNRTIQECTFSPIDDLRYGSISKKILDIVSKGNVRMGTVTPEESIADFAPIKEELNSLFAQENISLLEVKYIMDNIFASFTAVEGGFMGLITQHSQDAEAKLFGVEFMSDMTMKKLDDVMKAG